MSFWDNATQEEYEDRDYYEEDYVDEEVIARPQITSRVATIASPVEAPVKKQKKGDDWTTTGKQKKVQKEEDEKPKKKEPTNDDESVESINSRKTRKVTNQFQNLTNRSQKRTRSLQLP